MTSPRAHATFDGALDRTLAALEWRLLESRRHRMPVSSTFVRAHVGPGFLYVFTGSLRVSTGPGVASTLSAGDLVFFAREHTTAVVADEAVEFIDVGFEESTPPSAAAASLPASLTVSSFAEREPSMVALIDGMACVWSAHDGAVASASGRRPGDSVICSRIATTIVSTALRAWSEAGCAPEGWLRDVSEPQLALALAALHARPGDAWTLDELARTSRMSRSAFAARFQDVVGESPIGYLTRVRMETAKGLLLGGEQTIAAIAGGLGYESQAGFSRAFQRHVGTTPGRWRAASSRR